MKVSFPFCGKSKSSYIVAVLILGLFVGSHFLRTQWRAWKDLQTEARLAERSPEQGAKRIIALSPSCVEVLFALGQGERVVAVSRHTTYPPEATSIPKVGGFMDVDLEELLSHDPDCVVLLESQSELAATIESFGVKTLLVNHESVEGIIESFERIAKLCKVPEQGELLVKNTRAHIEGIQQKVAIKRSAMADSKPRVLVCIHHSDDASQPQSIVVCGNKGYHKDLVQIAGGVNAYQGNIAYPKLSREHLIEMNPDVIIDLVHAKVADSRSREELKKLWDVYPELDAVKKRRIVIADGAEHFLPGPRFLQTLDRFVEGIYGIKVEGGKQ